MSEVYKKLSAINVNNEIKTKGSLKYLSWSFAWDNLMKIYPASTYKVYEKDDVNYFNDGRSCWVKVGVTVESIEHIEMLPVMDFKNKAMPLNAVTSVDVNKTIQRALTKAIARHGLGIYIYAGEDLPTEEPLKEYISVEQQEEIEDLLLQTKADVKKFFQHYGIKKVADIETLNYQRIINQLKNKLKGMNEVSKASDV